MRVQYFSHCVFSREWRSWERISEETEQVLDDQHIVATAFWLGYAIKCRKCLCSLGGSKVQCKWDLRRVITSTQTPDAWSTCVIAMHCPDHLRHSCSEVRGTDGGGRSGFTSSESENGRAASVPCPCLPHRHIACCLKGLALRSAQKNRPSRWNIPTGEKRELVLARGKKKTNEWVKERTWEAGRAAGPETALWRVQKNWSGDRAPDRQDGGGVERGDRGSDGAHEKKEKKRWGGGTRERQRRQTGRDCTSVQAAEQIHVMLGHFDDSSVVKWVS